MNKPKEITIIGGGLAGLTLGIGLRRSGIPVTIFEKGSYPRHRVCGEFISGRGQAVLEKLGLLQDLRHQGAVAASKVKFVFPSGSTKALPINPPGLCFSRFKLDAHLAGVFRDFGGTLCENQTVREPYDAKGLIRATGRAVQSTTGGFHWFGLKAHFKNVTLDADLEMHCFRHGYVGLTQIEGGQVNVCGLFRRRDSERAWEWRQLLLGPGESPLRKKLHRAELQGGSFCAVAGLPIRAQRAADHVDCCLGDALTMTPPVTGNGLSMALESANIAVPALCEYSRGHRTWDDTHHEVAVRCDELLSQRLRWGFWLQRFLFQPWLQTLAGPYLLNSQLLWRVLFSRTR